MAALCAASVLASCQGKQAAKQGSGGPATPVSAATVEQKTMPLRIEAIGNVIPYATVEIRARVGGALDGIFFQEGEEVKTGQPLFRIDPRPYEVAVKEAEAFLARDRAKLENAQGDLARSSKLVESDYVTKEQFDDARSEAASMKAIVDADEAALRNARLDLAYCTIASPISGYAGDIFVDQGTLIKANGDKPMVVINQVRPIKVDFSVPEQYLHDIRSLQAKGHLSATARTRQGQGDAAQGSLSFVDNAVDTATGMILLRATFPNQDRLLWPGEFVDVILKLGEQTNAVVVPSRAIQGGQQGTYVFVIAGDSTVQLRPVKVSRTMGDETIVAEGLGPGERVVTDGQLRLTNGTRVEIKNEEIAPGREGTAP